MDRHLESAGAFNDVDLGQKGFEAAWVDAAVDHPFFALFQVLSIDLAKGDGFDATPAQFTANGFSNDDDFTASLKAKLSVLTSKIFPEVPLDITDGRGMTAMHHFVLLRWDFSEDSFYLDMYARLAQRDRKSQTAMMHSDKEGNTPLNLSIKFGNHCFTECILHRCGPEGRSSASVADKQGNFPLHNWLIESAMNSDQIKQLKELIQAYPAAVRAQNKQQLLPLQLAARYFTAYANDDDDADEDWIKWSVLKELGLAFPEAWKATTSNGETILHLLSKANMRDVGKQSYSLSYVLDKLSELQIPLYDKNGHCPLHCIGNHGAASASVLINKFQCALPLFDSKGNNVLHCVGPNASGEAVKALLKARPEMLMERNEAGRLPYEEALESLSSEAAVKVLCEASIEKGLVKENVVGRQRADHKAKYDLANESRRSVDPELFMNWQVEQLQNNRGYGGF